MVKERAFRFADDRRLMGVFTEAAEPVKSTGIILLNAGLVHHVGPYRMWVELARTLAAAGYCTLRFDLSGLGDSDAARDNRPHDEQAIDDIRDAIDWFQSTHGHSKFVLLGLCSGAWNAHAAAVADERIAGGVFLDGYAYATPQSRARHYAPRLLDPRRWTGFLRRRLAKRQAPTEDEDEVVFQMDFPDRSVIATELQQLAKRGMKMLYAFSGGFEQYYNYRSQFRDCFSDVDFGTSLQVEYFPLSDHTYTLLADRAKLFKLIQSWLAHQFR